MNSYELSRSWFDFAFENPEKIKPVHGILYFFCIEHCNRLGWKEKFGLPTTMAKEAIGVRSYNTYINALNSLVEWGFILMVEKSKNQYSSNIIALSKYDKALVKALDKALIKHGTKQSESTVQSTSESIGSIDKQYNKEQLNNKQDNNVTGTKRFTPPDLPSLKDYFFEKMQMPEMSKNEAEKFHDFYASKNWMVGKNKMKDWQAAVRNWIRKIKEENQKNGTRKQTSQQRLSDEQLDYLASRKDI